MSEEPTDYDVVFGAMCFAIPPNEEDEAFAALSRMDETIQQLRDRVDYLQRIVDSDCEWNGSDEEDEGLYRKKEQGQ
jgi:hypothetical protein